MVTRTALRGASSSEKTEIHPTLRGAAESTHPILRDHSEPTHVPFTLMMRPSRLRDGKPELVVDVEDTIVTQKEPTLGVLNDRYGVHVSIEEAISFKVQEVYKKKFGLDIERPEIIAIHRQLWAEGPQLVDPRIPKIMARLHKEWNLSLVTASVADSLLIMDRLGAQGIQYDLFERVESSSDKIKRRPRAFGSLDDHADVARDFAGMGGFGLVLDAPWNKGAEDKSMHIVRVQDWAEAERLLMGPMLADAREALKASARA